MCFVGGGLSSGSFVGVGTLVAMWFPKRQGQAMSIVAMGSNFGTMLFVPLLNVLAGSIGMPMGSVICGGVAAVVGVIGMALLRDTPKERGLYPDNVTEAEFKANYSSAPPELDHRQAAAHQGDLAVRSVHRLSDAGPDGHYDPAGGPQH